MFSFVDLRLVLLLGATVLLARAQGEDDRKFHQFVGGSPFLKKRMDFVFMTGRLLRS